MALSLASRPAILASLLLSGTLSASSVAAAADTTGPGPASFRACVEQVSARALEEGIDDLVVDEVLGAVRHLPRVIELDRRQPEFTRSFADYYERRVTAERVARGRALLARHRPLLERVQREYGVPPHYLVAFWGLETNFGSYFGRMSVPDALATLACDERRGPYFTGELISALRIIESGDISAERMEGSWAGAMGHVQFMPSVFLRHARDGDGDGRRNLWDSVPDAMVSAGNFLAELGWEPGLRWGREVRLPADFDYALAGRGRSRALADWVAMGVTDAYGNPLPALDLPASVLVPAGHAGPAFLVYENFDVIMGWNRSEFYALAVGRLADRIAGGGRLVRTPPETPPLAVSQVRLLQTRLNDTGFDAGPVDGILGSGTRRALAAFESAAGLVPDGHPDAEVLARLGVRSPKEDSADEMP